MPSAFTVRDVYRGQASLLLPLSLLSICALQDHACIQVSGHSLPVQLGWLAPFGHTWSGFVGALGFKTQWIQGRLRSSTYNIQGVGCGLAGWGPPLPPAADYGVQHCEPSVLHVIVEAVDVWDSTDLGVMESSLLSSIGTSSGRPATSVTRAASSVRGVIGDHVCGVWNLFLIVPTQYGVTAPVGVEGVASSPAGRVACGPKTGGWGFEAWAFLPAGRGCTLRCPIGATAAGVQAMCPPALPVSVVVEFAVVVSPARGHEATDSGLAYAPVSQAHGHNHIVQCFPARAMRQRKLGSHTPPCHRRMVITTLFSVLLAALQRRPVVYHTRWLLAMHWHWSSGH